jgi:hypothetical protein
MDEKDRQEWIQHLRDIKDGKVEPKHWWQFELNENERADFQAWSKEHKKVCHLEPEGITNGPCKTFCFTPFGFGTAIKVRCDCGEIHEIIDPDWDP